MFQPIDIQQKLVHQRNKKQHSKDVIGWVNSVFDAVDDEQNSVLERLSNSPIHRSINRFNLDLVDVNSIFHISHIEKICGNYRLRFLDSKYFKGDYPQQVILKIKELEKKHKTVLDGFKIIAPSKLFTLNDADDPLLFASMGNDYYYLIHKWGTDLHSLRKIKYWTIKNVENLLFSTFIFSILLTIGTQNLFFNKTIDFGYLVVLFLFYFKGIVAMIFFYGVASGKNFSQYCWTSKYNKIS